MGKISKYKIIEARLKAYEECMDIVMRYYDRPFKCKECKCHMENTAMLIAEHILDAMNGKR